MIKTKSRALEIEDKIKKNQLLTIFNSETDTDI
jgi:hypothetical protein